MAITEPLSFIDTFPGWSTVFNLPVRQEQSITAGGVVTTKNFGVPLWRASYVTKSLRANEHDKLASFLEMLENDQLKFNAWKTSRKRPIKHPGNAPLSAGTLHSLDPDNKTIRVAGFTGIEFSAGDHIQINGNLHRVLEDAATTLGISGYFEVRPHIWPGTAPGDLAVISRPSCLMRVVPKSVSSQVSPRTGRGVISFQAVEARG